MNWQIGKGGDGAAAAAATTIARINLKRFSWKNIIFPIILSHIYGHFVVGVHCAPGSWIKYVKWLRLFTVKFAFVIRASCAIDAADKPHRNRHESFIEEQMLFASKLNIYSSNFDS